MAFAGEKSPKMVDWKEREHKDVDTQAMNDPNFLEVLGACGLVGSSNLTEVDPPTPRDARMARWSRLMPRITGGQQMSYQHIIFVVTTTENHRGGLMV